MLDWIGKLITGRNFQERLAELPINLSNHLRITIIALGVGVLISVPLAVCIARVKRLRYPVLTGAGVIQTVPSLALLALMVPILDRTGGLGLGLAAFGFWPAVIALTMYSILPILRNTVTGILGVDPAMTEAARGLGMTTWQTLFKVELPLSAAVIIAGIRTSTVWVVGIATLATPVGQRCLGNYIFTGLQTRNWVMVMFGVVGAAVLAIMLDMLIGGLQKAVEDRRRGLGLTSGGLLAVVMVGGLISPQLAAWLSPAQAGETEAYIAEERAQRQVVRLAGASEADHAATLIGDMAAGALRDEGLAVSVEQDLGSDEALIQLADRTLDAQLDFDGAAWRAYRDDTAPPDRELAPWKRIVFLRDWLATQHEVRAMGVFGRGGASETAPYQLAMLLGPTVANQRNVTEALKPLVRRFRPATAASARRPDAATSDQAVIRVGAKTFAEQYILANLIERVLKDAGYDTQRTESLGSTIVFDALVQGRIDIYVDYSGTIWANAMKRQDTAAPWRVRTEMAGWLAREHDIRSLGTLGFENAYKLAMRREQAEALGIETIDDLVEHAPDMAIGGDYEFFGRPEWANVRSAYGLSFAEQKSFDHTIMYDAIAQGDVDVVSAFSTDGQIAVNNLVLLHDPRRAIPPYDAVLLMSEGIAGDDAVVRALMPLIGAITPDLMQRANAMVDREEDKKTAGEAAGWLLEEVLGARGRR